MKPRSTQRASGRRRISRARLALTSEGDLVLNAADLDVRLTPGDVLTAALEQRGEVFIGVVLSRRERQLVLREGALILPNITGPLCGRRIRAVGRPRRPGQGRSR